MPRPVSLGASAKNNQAQMLRARITHLSYEIRFTGVSHPDACKGERQQLSHTADLRVRQIL